MRDTLCCPIRNLFNMSISSVRSMFSRGLRNLIRPDLTQNKQIQGEIKRLPSSVIHPVLDDSHTNSLRKAEEFATEFQNLQTAYNSRREEIINAIDQLGESPSEESILGRARGALGSFVETSIQLLNTGRFEELGSELNNILSGHRLAAGLKNPDGTPMEISNRQLKVKYGEKHKSVKYENGPKYPGLKKK